MKNALPVGLALAFLALAAAALILAADGARRIRTEQQRTLALEEQVRTAVSRQADTEARLVQTRSEFAAELGRVREALATQGKAAEASLAKARTELAMELGSIRDAQTRHREELDASLAKVRTDIAAWPRGSDASARPRDFPARDVPRDPPRRAAPGDIVADFTHCYWHINEGGDFDFAPAVVVPGKTTTAVSSNGTRYSLTLSKDSKELSVIQENKGSARISSYVRRGGTAGRLSADSYLFNGVERAGAKGYVLLQTTAEEPAAPAPAPADTPR